MTSKTAWTLVPPYPKLFKLRRRSPEVGHGVIASGNCEDTQHHHASWHQVLTFKFHISRGMAGLGLSNQMLGGMIAFSRTSTDLIKPATPLAASR